MMLKVSLMKLRVQEDGSWGRDLHSLGEVLFPS